MDELAFVESLFTAEMRAASSIFPSPLPACNRVKALCTPPGSGNGSLVPPPPNSLLGGGIALSQYLAPFQPSTSEDTSLFVRLNEDDMFTQMLSDQDFADFPPSFKKGYDVIPKPASTNSSLLLEPLDLLKSNSEKDTSFSTNAMTFPQSIRSARSLRAAGSATATGYTFDTNTMTGFPFGSNPSVEFSAGGSYANFSPSPSPNACWMHDEEMHVSAPDTPKVHTNKYMMTMTGMMQQPSPGSVDMFDPIAATSSGHWISMLKNSEPSLPEEGNPLVETAADCPPFSLTISPPSSWTNKALKELIVSADFGVPAKTSRQKRARSGKSDIYAKVKAAKTSSTTSPMNPLTRPLKTSKGKKCVENGCTRRAQSNSRCKAHGGGARCQYAGPGGCTRSSQGGGFCRAHGGGKRCEFPGCTRGQQRKGRCYVHGGIRKCQYGVCEKKDRGNGFCIAHGGGKRCEYPNCSRAVRRGLLCQIHDSQATMGNAQRGNVLL